VGVCRERDLQLMPVSHGAQGTQVAARVDGEYAPVTEVDEIAGVAEALVDQRNDGRVAHAAPLVFAPAGSVALIT
jgi:hypothetical protein